MRLPRRLFLLALVFAAASALVVGLGAARLLERQLEEAAVERLAREAELLADTLPGPLGGDPAPLWPVAAEYARRLAVRVTLVDPSGRVVVDSERTPADVGELENHAARPELVEAREKGIGRARRFSASVGVDLLYVGVRIERAGKPAGFVRLAIPFRTLAETDAEYRRFLAFFVAGGVLVSGLLAAWLAIRLGRRVDAIRAAAQAIAAGEHARPIDESGEDELGEMARAVGKMRENLVAALERADGERARIDSLVRSIDEGVLVVDDRLAVVFSNPRMNELFDFPADPEGRPLVECLRLPDAVDAFREAFEAETPVARTIRPERGARASILELRVVVAANPDTPGRRTAVGLFLDMTRLDALEKTRQRFVADVSHELRTPLTSARAAAETIAAGDGVPTELTRFSTMLIRQLAKMQELVDDLTDLSAIETGSIPLEREPVPLAEVLGEVADEIESKWAGRGVRVKVDADAGLRMMADRRRLVQIVTNLVDNAAKFSPEGETVDLRAGGNADTTWFEVEDRGPGVAEKDRERIFQRFFQVDRSRSKLLPGTGLGLAIVKHLVALQGGRIELRSEPGKGSCFRVEFPGVE